MSHFHVLTDTKIVHTTDYQGTIWSYQRSDSIRRTKAQNIRFLGVVIVLFIFVKSWTDKRLVVRVQTSSF